MGAPGLRWVFLALVTPGVLGQCKFRPRYSFAKPSVQSNQAEFAIGTDLKYECLPGFKKKIFVIRCLETSEWSEVQQPCERKSCVSPGELLHGSVLAPLGLEFGSRITYSCDEGYRLIGDSTANCVVLGKTVTWDAEMPICESIPCPSPPAIANGHISSGNADSFSYGMVVTYRCNVGPRGEKLFHLVGDKSLHCTSYGGRVGEWSGSAPSCIPLVKCPFPEVENGLMVSGFRRSFSSADSVMFSCRPGFTMRGSNMARCQEDGNWSPPLPRCLQGCPPPPHIPHGSHNAGHEELFTLGREVAYSCEPGYTLSGTNPLKCLASGAWSHDGPHCEVQSCTAIPTQLPNGRVVAPPNLQLGAEVFFICDKGFRLRGDPASQCVPAGMTVAWSHPLFPVCERISCNPPPALENGRNSYTSGQVEVGSVVSYRCLYSFRLIGESILLCVTKDQKTGVWDKAIPMCEAYNRLAKCKEPTVPGASRDKRFRPPYRHGDKVMFTCKENLTMKGNKTVWCLSNSTWGPNPLPTCESDIPKECPPLPAIPNGQHTGENMGTFTLGQSVTYSCEHGYLLQGQKTLSCLSLGEWSAAPPTCQEPRCPPPGPFSNGQVQGPSSLRVGETMTFHCNPGYWLQGQPSSKCVVVEQQATWTRMPICEEILCPPPPPILHGRPTGHPLGPAPLGSTVTYTCDPGPEEGASFVLQGASTRHCVSDGQGSGLWNGSVPHCQLSAPLRCPAPRVRRGWVQSGKKEHYSYNDTVLFTCEAGFSLKGSPGARCTARGTWEPPAPECEKECQAPPEILNGHKKERGQLRFPPGASVTYSCMPGHELESEGTIRCTPDGEWMPAIPRCRVAECDPVGKKVFARPHGQFVRAAVNASCEEGYRLAGSAFQGCQGPPLWFLETRLCEEITCPPPPAILDGSHTGSTREKVPYGTMVTYVCRRGPEPGVDFELLGQPILRCTSLDQRQGVWSGPAPVCRLTLPAAHCLPVSVAHGRQVSGLKAAYSYNDSITFQCDPGFTLKGSRQIRCRADSSWGPEIPVCEKGCGLPPGLPHGWHSGASQALFVPGTQVNYSCNPGYVLVGSTYSRCAPSGTWSPSGPRCEEIPCQPVGKELQEPPPGAHVVTVNTSCPDGQQLVRHTYQQCQDAGSGVWFQRLPRCEAIYCQPPPAISHGQHTGSSGQPFLYGQEVSYTCDPGFSLLGEPVLRCGTAGQGSWSGPAPRCELPPRTIYCPNPEVKHGHTLNGTDPPYSHNDMVLVACNPGFIMNGSHVIRCHSSGLGAPAWVPGVPMCIKEGAGGDSAHSAVSWPVRHATPASSGCHRPPQIPNGNHTGGDDARFPPGASVLYSCHQGYLLVGAAQLFCTHEGVWSPPVPACTEVNCSFPAHLRGTQRTYQYGAIVTVECEDGYTLEGSSQSQCQDNHRWDPPLAECRSQGSLVPLLTGLSSGFILLICLISVILCKILRHRERNYYTNTGPKEGDLHLEPRGVHLVDPYNPAS